MISLNRKAIDEDGLWNTAKKIHRCCQEIPLPDIFNELLDARLHYLSSVNSLVIVTKAEAKESLKFGGHSKNFQWKLKKRYTGGTAASKPWRKASPVCRNCINAEKRIGTNENTRYFCEDHLVSQAGTCPVFETKYKLELVA